MGHNDRLDETTDWMKKFRRRRPQRLSGSGRYSWPRAAARARPPNPRLGRADAQRRILQSGLLVTRHVA